MAAHKREKASGRKGWGLGSTWNVKLIHVGIGFVAPVFRCPRFTLSSFYVGTGLRWYGFTLSSFSVVLVLRWDVGTGFRFYVVLGLRCPRFTVEAGDWVTLRGC